ncbi:hypothetical protein [Cellulosimicrobium protaetiae]|jgi:hypothetical protein|uniref:Uncharacterized protein n=1 Tax=Cellulosimicrobium protaetiae TaxID=2587808 RepID=A0A6M5UFC5_9MICO|nr:hypothetical protein [Cellulosimicrobium protaetiae]QJW35329.1 hypothetical protein FIC82_003050 [Cellulosimicrobium protaetiae]
MGIGPIYPLLILLYVAVIATVAVLVIWALILTIRLLRSVLAERDARARAGWTPPPA